MLVRVCVGIGADVDKGVGWSTCRSLGLCRSSSGGVGGCGVRSTSFRRGRWGE